MGRLLGGSLAFLVVLGGCADANFGSGDAGAPDDAAGPDDAAALDAGSEAATADAAGDAPADAGTPPLTCNGETSEPNETEVLASPLGTIDDCDGSGSSVSGVSSGIGDTDWLHFVGTDTFGCSVDPTVQINTTGLRLCAFALCLDGTTTVSDCGVGAPATSPAGTHGCCTGGTASMTLQINCSGSDDAANVFVRVDQPTTNVCVSYDVTYHF